MIIENFQYLFTKVTLVTDNADIFKIVYESYKGKWKNNCVYEEFGDFTVRLDFKQMKVYMYCSQNDGIVFDELVEAIEILSNKKYKKMWRDGDWKVLQKEYQISFYTKDDMAFHTTDSNFFVLTNETGKIILQRTQYYNEEDNEALYGVIAPVIVDIEKIFKNDFIKSDNKLFELEFQKLIDDIYHKEVMRVTENLEDETV